MLTIRQIRDLAAAEWNRYFNRKFFHKRTYLLCVASVLLVVSFVMMLVLSAFINDADPRQLTTRVIPSGADTISVTVNSYGFVSAYQNSKELPVLGINTVTSPVREIPGGLNGLSLAILVTSCVLFLMWYFGYVAARERYIDHISHLWVSSVFKQVPDEQSVIDFVAKEG